MTNQEASKIIKDGLEDMSLDFADDEQYEALTMAIKALEEPSGDLISRQAVLEQIHCWIGSGEYRYTNATHYLTERVKHIPSAKQERTGHWIEKDGKEQGYDIGGVKTWYMQIMCSECGFIKTAIEGHIGQYNYCPNCGAKMAESEE